MAQLAIQNLFKLAPVAGGPWNLPHKFHLYLIIIIILLSLCSPFSIWKFYLLFNLQLSTLADLCIEILPIMLTVENVCPILKISYKWRLHRHHTIHQRALILFCKHKKEIEENFYELKQQLLNSTNPPISLFGWYWTKTSQINTAGIHNQTCSIFK